MLSAIVLNVIMLNGIMLSAVLSSVVAPIAFLVCEAVIFYL
jgi:hypothetical protein